MGIFAHHVLSSSPTQNSGEKRQNKPQIALSYCVRTLFWVWFMGKTLSNEELVGLIRIGVDRDRNLLQLFQQNYGIIMETVSRLSYYAERDDLTQEAFFGLLRAVDIYEPEGGANFATVLKFCVESVLIAYVYKSNTVRIPAYKKKQILEYEKIRAQWQKLHGSEPSLHEVAFYLGISMEAALSLVADADRLRSRSLSDPIADDFTIADSIEDPSAAATFDSIELHDLNMKLWQAVDNLGGSDADLVKRRYVNCESLKQIAADRGVTIGAIQNKCKRNLNKLKHNRNVRDAASVYGISLQSGLGAFKRTWTSSPELYCIKLEDFHGKLNN